MKCTRCGTDNSTVKQLHAFARDKEYNIFMCQFCWANWALWLMKSYSSGMTLEIVWRRLQAYASDACRF